METYEAAFKKKHSGKLLWVECEATTNAEATIKLRSFVNTNHEGKGYRLYGGPMVQNLFGR